MDGVNRDAVITHKDMEFQWGAHEQVPERGSKESLASYPPVSPHG